MAFSASKCCLVHLLLCLFFITSTHSSPETLGHGLHRIPFDVTKYGAVADGKTDNSQAFLGAWNAACKTKGRTVLQIPQGTYMVGLGSWFSGPCQGSVLFEIRGTLVAPTNPAKIFGDTWIGFKYVSNLVVLGVKPYGILHGRGESAWKYNDCRTNPQCKHLPVSLRFDFVNNSAIQYLTSIDSKSAHMHLFASSNILISKVKLTAPADSPNTDGIDMGLSTGINITQSHIGTGDDCIAMLVGSRDIDISHVFCGPGHGISIGSIGKGYENVFVNNIKVRHCRIKDADNGVRIKTWADSSNNRVSNILYEDIIMDNVQNPIIIDQQYCPSRDCPKGNSRVQIETVWYRDIRGTTGTKVAVNLVCSNTRPCKNVKFNSINLQYNGKGKKIESMCYNVEGLSRTCSISKQVVHDR